MGNTRIVAVGAALTALAIPAPAASAAPQDKPQATYSPQRFTPGDNLWVRVTGCLGEPRVSGTNEAFDEGEPGSFERSGDAWTGIGGTLRTLKSGNSYLTRLGCVTGKGFQTFPLWVTPPDRIPPAPPSPPGKPRPEPPPGGGFTFGHDDVDLSTRTVMPGGRLGIRVTCPAPVRATSASFVSEPRFERVGEDGHRATARFESTLPSIVKVRVECRGYGSVTFSTRPGQKHVDPGDQSIPQGSPNTGDGSMADTDNSPGYALPVAGSLVLVGVYVLHRRRRARA
ncbi:hypothetical protein SMC26_42825 [Actinomadura fulvescens]|uniref:LPXTG cell wall anchor domain-containing protein n=1 Tax=Actinomadura fulvescens TaxID=46160 RepID=A0ABN3PK31_9ACTN